MPSDSLLIGDDPKDESPFQWLNKPTKTKPALKIQPQEAQLVPLVQAWQKDPRQETLAPAWGGLQPLIHRATQSVLGPGQHSSQIKGHAKRMALGALAKYDPAQSSLATYLNRSLMGLHRVQRQVNESIPISERAIFENRRLQSAQAELEDKLQRTPSMAEVSAETGLSLDKIRRLRATRSPLASGLMDQVNEGEEEGPGMPATYQPGVKSIDTWTRVIYDELDPTDQRILEWTLGWHGETLGTDGIAKKLKISAPAISQRKAKIQKLLDEGARFNIFGD